MSFLVSPRAMARQRHEVYLACPPFSDVEGDAARNSHLISQVTFTSEGIGPPCAQLLGEGAVRIGRRPADEVRSDVDAGLGWRLGASADRCVFGVAVASGNLIGAQGH